MGTEHYVLQYQFGLHPSEGPMTLSVPDSQFKKLRRSLLPQRNCFGNTVVGYITAENPLKIYLNIVPLPGLSSEQHQGDAGGDATEIINNYMLIVNNILYRGLLNKEDNSICSLHDQR
jgi:hypothetical protein